ncbi:MAG: energy transducer TonB [Mucilaginibacter sp.]
MKWIVFFLLIGSNIAFAQTSRLYDKDRKLLVDKIFVIDTFSFSNIANVEKILLPKMYNGIKYSALARENEIEGTVIVRLSIGPNGQNYAVKVVKSDSEELSKTVLDFFNNLSVYTKNDISPQKGEIVIFLPVKYEILKDEYNSTLNKNHSVTIRSHPSAPVITIVND